MRLWVFARAVTNYWSIFSGSPLLRVEDGWRDKPLHPLLILHDAQDSSHAALRDSIAYICVELLGSVLKRPLGRPGFARRQTVSNTPNAYADKRGPIPIYAQALNGPRAHPEKHRQLDFG
jgi:hypothetical protein